MTYTTEQKLAHLATLVDERRKLNQAIDQLVLELRSPDLHGHCEASWAEVAASFGVSRQAVQQMYTRGRR